MYLANLTHLFQNNSPLTLDEIRLSEEIANLFIADAEQVAREQSNRRYRIKTADVVKVLEEFKHLPFSVVLSVLCFEYSCFCDA